MLRTRSRISLQVVWAFAASALVGALYGAIFGAVYAGASVSQGMAAPWMMQAARVGAICGAFGGAYGGMVGTMLGGRRAWHGLIVGLVSIFTAWWLMLGLDVNLWKQHLATLQFWYSVVIAISISGAFGLATARKSRSRLPLVAWRKQLNDAAELQAWAPRKRTLALSLLTALAFLVSRLIS
jgi:hypothetical protein